MRVIIKKNYEECSKWAASHIAERVNREASEAAPFVLGLPTGSTPLGAYGELCRMFKTGSLSFKNVITFNMDEYVGLKADDEQSYHHFMEENLFSHIDIDRENIHILDGMAENLEEECANYEKGIKAAGGIKLFLGGVGSDGHIAFNEPGTSLVSRTHKAFLTKETIQANARFFDGKENAVPRYALTVGVATITDAEEVLIIATGRAKARAVQAGVEGDVTHSCALSVLQMHKNAIIVCDEDAAEELKMKTINYFNQMEEAMRD